MLRSGTYGTSVECLALSEVFKLNFEIYFLVSDGNDKKINDIPTIISKLNHNESIRLIFSGNPSSGHFNLLNDKSIKRSKPTLQIPCPICSRSFKNEKGLKIHQTRVHSKIKDNLLSSRNLLRTTKKTYCN